MRLAAPALVLVACTREPIDVPLPAQPGLSVEDVAASSGYDDFDLGGHFKRGRGCTLADFDNDGDDDVFLSNPADESYVLRNDTAPGGPIRFTPDQIIADGTLPWAGAAADYDNDGDVDLFVGVGGLEGFDWSQLMRNELVETGAMSFTDVTWAAGVAGPTSPRTGEPAKIAALGVSWVDIDEDGLADIYVDGHVFPLWTWDDLPEDTIIGHSVVWHNQGDGTFVDISDEVGLSNIAPHRYSSWLDVDGDGDLDLYENNWSVAYDVLWRNLHVETGTVTFEDATTEWSLGGADLRFPLESFASATEDLNNDGWPDLIAYVRGWPAQGPHLLGHTIFLNVEGRGFVDATAATGLAEWFEPGFLRDHLSLGVMGNQVADVNLDGIHDFYIGNGGPGGGFTDQLFLSTGLEEVTFDGVGTVMVPTYENRSELIDFPPEHRPAAEPYPPYPFRTHGTCAGDFDRDDQIEIAVSEGGMSYFGGTSVQEPNRLFRVLQNPKPHILWVDVQGDASIGLDALYTTVTVTVGKGDETWTIPRTVRTSNGFSAQNGHDLWFGLGDADRIEAISVAWPDGRVDAVDPPALDSRIVVSR